MRYFATLALVFLSTATLHLVSPRAVSGEDDTNQAERILQSMRDFYQNVSMLQVRIDHDLQITVLGPQEQTHEIKAQQQVSLNRPSQFSIANLDETNPNGYSAFLSNGTGVVSLGEMGAIRRAPIRDVKTFVEDPELGYDAANSFNRFSARNSGLTLLLQLLVASDVSKSMESLTYVGTDESNGRKVHHLQANTTAPGMRGLELMKMDLWVLQGPQPLITKVVVSNADSNPDPAVPAPAARITSTNVFSKWNVERPASADAFAIPELNNNDVFSTFIEFARALQTPALRLVGKPATDFELELLDGESFQLSKHQGKVVVLDFWATWCGPCIMALPKIMAATSELADQGVVLIAVNQQEDVGTVQGFLTDKSWDLTVAMDQDGQVAGSYRVTGIPQTVIVGKDGIIKKVRVGFDPNLESVLKAELKEVLAE